MTHVSLNEMRLEEVIQTMLLKEKHLSRWLELVLEATKGGLYIHSVPLDETTWYNDQWAKILGYRSDEIPPYEVFLEWFFEKVHPDDRAFFDKSYRDFIEGSSATYEVEIRIQHKSGPWIWVRVVSKALEHSSEGEVRRIIGMMFDITELKQAENALRKSLETSEALNRINEVLHSTLNFKEIMQHMVTIGADFLKSESAAISERSGDSWIVRNVHGMPSNLVGSTMDSNKEKHAVLALNSRQPVVVNDALNDNRFEKEHMRRHNIRSVLVVPLIFRAEAYGVIFFNYHKATHKFTQEEVNFAIQIGNIAALAVTNARFFEARKIAEDKLREINSQLEQRVKDRSDEIEAQYKELEELNEIIRQMARKTIEAMENERKAIAKELHDSIAGTLSAIKLQLEGRVERMNASTNGLPSNVMSIEKIVEYLAEAIAETRQISRQLRSPTLDELGLKAALVEHIQHFKQFHPQIEVVSQIEIAIDIPDDIKTALYRVVQESLNNIGKHSAATVVRVKLTAHTNQICLEIADNGLGFDIQQVLSDSKSLMGYGIHSMRERIEMCQGKFQIRSEPEKGTVIDITISI